MIDYDALAQQHGGIDYDAYAKQFGGNVQNDISQTQEQPQKSVGGFFGNLIKSGANLIGNTVQSIVHPIQTAETVGRLGLGAGEKLLSNRQDQNTQLFDQLVNMEKQRYGSIPQAFNTAYQDPLGTGLDISTLLTGAGGLLGKLGEVGKLGEIGQTGQTLAKAGEVANIPGKVMETLSPLARIASKGVQGIKHVLPSISDESTNIIKNASPERLQQIEAMSKQATLPINPIIEDVKATRDALAIKQGNEFKTALENARKQNITYELDKRDFTSGLKEYLNDKFPGTVLVKGKIENSPFSRQERNVIEGVLDEVKNSNVKSIDDLRNLKARIYSESDQLIPNNPALKKPQGYFAVREIANSLDNALPKQLRAANKLYSSRQKLIDTFNELVPAKAQDRISPTALNKIKNLTKEEYQGIYKNFFEGVKKETGKNLLEPLENYAVAKEINPNLIPQDIGGITRGIQKAANPIIGQYQLEKAKFLQNNPIKREIGSNFFNLIKQGSKKAFENKGNTLQLLTKPSQLQQSNEQ